MTKLKSPANVVRGIASALDVAISGASHERGVRLGYSQAKKLSALLHAALDANGVSRDALQQRARRVKRHKEFLARLEEEDAEIERGLDLGRLLRARREAIKDDPVAMAKWQNNVKMISYFADAEKDADHD